MDSAAAVWIKSVAVMQVPDNGASPRNKSAVIVQVQRAANLAVERSKMLSKGCEFTARVEEAFVANGGRSASASSF